MASNKVAQFHRPGMRHYCVFAMESVDDIQGSIGIRQPARALLCNHYDPQAEPKYRPVVRFL